MALNNSNIVKNVKIVNEKKIIIKRIFNKSFSSGYFSNRKKVRKINKIIFWYILGAEIGKKLAESEKKWVFHRNKMGNRSKIKKNSKCF